MSRHRKAPSAGSTERVGKSRRLFGRAFAVRFVASGIDGSGACGSARLGSSLAVLALVILALAVSAAPAGAAPPTLTTGSVENVSYASAHVTGEIGPTTHEAQYYFQYSADGVSWSNGPEAFQRFAPKGTASSTPVSEDLKNLKGGTHYFVRLAEFDYAEIGEFFSAEPYPSFTTLPVDPPAFVRSDAASEVAYTTAEATGEVERPAGNPDPAFDVTCHFEYVSDQQFSESGFQFPSRTDCAENPIEAEGVKAPVSAQLKFLAPNTTYHLRLSAENAGGTVSDEAPATFTTGTVDPPTTAIDPVTTFTDTTAHFSGQVTPGGTNSVFGTSWEFTCDPACPGQGSAGTIDPPDNAPHTVSFDPNGLEPNTTYQVDLIASNGGGTERAGPVSFKTDAAAPIVETIAPFGIEGGTEALIGGRVNPRNSSTAYWIEYGAGPGGPGAGYSNTIPASKDADAGSGGQFVVFARKIEGLTPQTTYHYRIVAENPTGLIYGEDVSFATLAPPAAPPASCPNDKLRSETGSEALDECRAYEMATPPDKNGGDAVGVTTSAPDGNRLAYFSVSGFGDTEANSLVSSYISERTPTGWGSRAVNPKIGSPSATGSTSGYVTAEVTPDVSVALAGSRASAAEPRVKNIFLVKADGTTTWVTEPTVPVAASELRDKNYVGRSADGSHIVFESSQPFQDGVTGSSSQIYEWVDGQVRLVSLLPDSDGGGVPPEGAGVGNGSNGSNYGGTGFDGTFFQPTAVSEDGSRIFWGRGGSGASDGIFVRENGTETRELDLSQRVGSVGEPAPRLSSYFVGAAADGSVVVFKSSAQLTNNATPGGGLYAFDLESNHLSFLSAGATGTEGARLENYSLISEDASHVYFVARSILVPGKGIPGGHNLYVAGEDEVRFIATLNDDDSQDWETGPGETTRRSVKATPDGRHFVFQSYERLTAFDNAGHDEVYLYDADSGSISCVSCGLDDSAPDADASILPNPRPRGGSIPGGQVGRQRVITSDASRILFQSAEALLPSDVNGVADVYLWNEGQLQLVSAGTGKYPSEVGEIDPDGRDLFFFTRDSLVGQDIDGGARDVYDARIGGGFPAPTVANPCESAAACQRTPSSSPEFTSPPTTAPGRGNTPHHKKPGQCKGKKKHRKCGSKKAKNHKKNKHKKNVSNGRGK